MNCVYLINTLGFVALESYIMKTGLYKCYRGMCAVNAICVFDGTVLFY